MSNKIYKIKVSAIEAKQKKNLNYNQIDSSRIIKL